MEQVKVDVFWYRVLDAGHTVVMLTRNPAAMPIQHERLTVLKGDISDRAHVDVVIQGADAVMSTLGAKNSSPPYSISKGFDNILPSMKHTTSTA